MGGAQLVPLMIMRIMIECHSSSIRGVQKINAKSIVASRYVDCPPRSPISR